MALTQGQVSQLYVSAFGRASEGDGSAYWMANGTTVAATADTMLGSPAAIEYFGDALDTDQAFVEFIYLNTLGKTVAEDPDGIAFWVDQLTAGDTRGEVVAGMVWALVNGDFTGDAEAIAAQDQFNNRVSVSNYTADTIQTADVADLTAFTGYISGVTDDPTTVSDAMDVIDADAAAGAPVEFALTSDVPAIGVQEGDAAVFTITASKAVTEDTVVTFTVVPDDAMAADQGTNSTNLNDFSAGSFSPKTVTILAGETTATFSVSGSVDGITELPEAFSVTAEVGGDTLTATADMLDGAGTFVLTTAQDNIVGATGDDTIIGLVDGSNNTLTLGDQINGNDGTDTLSITADTGFNLSLATLTSIEKMVINSSDSETYDLNGETFENVRVKVSGNTGTSTVDGVVAGADIDIVVDMGADVDMNFDTDASTATANLAVNIAGTSVDLGTSSDVDLEYDYTSATTVNSVFNVSNFISAADYIDVYETYTLAKEDVAFNHTLNLSDIDTVDDSTYGDYYLELNHAGDLVYTGTMNLTNVDDMYIEIDIDDDGNGETLNDSLVINMDNVQNSSGNTQIYLDELIDDVTINVITDSELDYFDNYDDDAATDVSTLTFNLDGNLVIDSLDLGDSGIVNVVVTGSGDLTMDSADDITTLDGSTATGDIVITNDFDSDATSIETGSGDDSIIVGSDETAVTMNDGDDTVDTNGQDFGADDDSATVDGGDGTDTVGIIDSSLADAAYMANVINFETLEIAGATNVAAYDLDVMGFTDVKLTGTTTAVVVTLDNVASDAVLTMTALAADTDLTGGGTLVYTAEDASAADDTAVFVMNATDTDTDQTAEGQATAQIDITQDAASKGVEIVALTSNAVTASTESALGADDALTSADYANTLDIDATEMTTLLIDGNAQAAVTFTDKSALALVNATASTASVNIDASGAGLGIGFNGSAGADTYLASDGGDTVQANAGADLITLGGGNDTVRYVSVTDSQLTLTDTSDPADGIADAASGYDVVTWEAVGTNIIELSSQLGLATGDARSDVLQLGDFNSADAVLTAAEIQAIIGDGVDFFDTGLVDRAVAIAVNDAVTITNDQTFVFVDANGDGDFTQADDMMIELSGVAALAIAEISFG